MATTRKAPARRKVAARPPRTPAKKSRPAEQQLSTRQPSREEVERRAYEIWKARGGEHGSHQDDWLRAERELAGES